MARPREFDRDAAVQRAMSVFWRKGYAATSTDDLLRAMNIGRQSMYDTFGDKHRLYLEALDDSERAARFVETTMFGLQVAAKAGASLQSLRDTAAFAIASLRNQ